METMQKSRERPNKHTHKTQDMLSGKPFREKTLLEGEATFISFSVWKYGYKYKEVMIVACGLLQCTNPLYVIYLLFLLAIFSQLWNKILSKEWNSSSS